MADELRWVLGLIEDYEGTWSDTISMGEGPGIAGILTGIALIGRCSADESYASAALEALAYEKSVYMRYGEKFGTCPYFEFCGGGCRALGVLLTGERDSFLHEDLSKCMFFENGWYQRVVQALPGWTNLSEIPII